MFKLELDGNRSDRNPWIWTDRHEKQAAHVMQKIAELKRWHPLTARQINYRLISSMLIKEPCWQWGGKTINSYQAVVSVLKWMRIDDRIPWNTITDEHRVLTAKLGFHDKDEFIDIEVDDFLEGYNRCLAQKQEYYIEVWIEKAALLHIIKPIVDKYCRRVVVCRGYNSITFQTQFYKRVERALNIGEKPLVLYLGDWDPSGENMIYAAMQTLEDELGLCGVEYYRLGINPEHFKEIPANPIPIKPKDTRSKNFVEKHGPTAYELDAFHPEQLEKLVEKGIQKFTDMNKYNTNILKEYLDSREIIRLKSKVKGFINDERWSG